MQSDYPVPLTYNTPRTAQEAQEGTYQGDPLPPYRVEETPYSRGLQELLEGVTDKSDYAREEWELPRSLNESLTELTDADNPDNLSELDILKGIYGPLNLFNVKLSKSTMRRYQRWLTLRKVFVDRAARGSKHYNYQRKRYRINNYRRWADLKKNKDDYRASLHGIYIDKKCKASEQKVPFHLTEEELTGMLEGLGTYPGTDIPYWKLTARRQKDGLWMTRLDAREPWTVENTQFKYKGKLLALGKNLLVSQPLLPNKVEDGLGLM